MKKLPLILVWAAMVFFVIIIAVVNNPLPTNYANQNAAIPLIETNLKSVIEAGFKKGEVDLLSPYFDEIISICIQDKEDIYLANNAKTVLSNFFESFPPKQFVLKHDGKSRGGRERYWIGDYITITDVKFRVYVFTEKELIQEIEISDRLMAM